MRISDVGELGLIDRIRARGLVRADGVLRGIGDDAAVFRLGAGRVAVVTTDLLIEGVHFRLPRSNPATLGAKALLVSLSDLAAMGARPREAFLGLAVPGSLAVETIEAFVDGFVEAGRGHGVNLLGGDTSASPRGMVIAVTVVGDAEEGTLVFRSGAAAGDLVYVTGNLGDSAGGLLLLERGCDADTPDRQTLIRTHHLPRAYVAEGEWISRSGAATAMIDLSDGLATDLRHVLAESGGLGACLDASSLPISAALKATCFELDEDPIDLALAGGEDYRLAVTVKPEAGPILETSYRERFGERLVRIGKIETEPGLRLVRGGRTETVDQRGFRHWRSC